MATVTAALGQGTAVAIGARQFTWTSDEPEAAGGTDTGPTPYEILLGALAACIAVTLRLYADHKGIALEGVDVRLEFDRVHADDCVDCDQRSDGWIERIRSEVTIRGDFDYAQRARSSQVSSSFRRSTGSTRASARLSPRISSANDASAAARRATSVSRAPARASSKASALPMPADAPVTTTCVLLRSIAL